MPDSVGILSLGSSSGGDEIFRIIPPTLCNAAHSGNPWHIHVLRGHPVAALVHPISSLRVGGVDDRRPGPIQIGLK